MNLNDAQIKKILEFYAVGTVLKYHKTDAGVANHNWIVKTNKGSFVLRCVPKWKKLRHLELEFKYLAYFHKRLNYKVPVPTLSRNKKPSVAFKQRLFWLYQLIEGKTKKTFFENELRETAKLMAAYHKILMNSGLDNGKRTTSIKNPHILKELATQRKRAQIAKRRCDSIYLSEVDELIKIYKQLDSKNYFKLKSYPLHRDINPENIIFRNRNAVGLIDFDNVTFYKEPLIKDVVILLMYSCRNQRDRKKLDFAKARFFIREYKKHRKLNDAEIKLIPLLAASNAIEDFSYVQWLFNNDPKRAKLYRLKLYANVAKWFWNNREMIANKLSD